MLVFGLFLFIIQLIVNIWVRQGWGPQAINLFGLTLVVVVGTFLVVAGYAANQVAPMFGLLGRCWAICWPNRRAEAAISASTPARDAK